METKNLVDSILETVKSEITDFVEQESSITCPIEYETRLLDIARNVAKNILLGTQGTLPRSRNSKKKVHTTFGKVSLKKDHILCPSNSKFAVSHHLQEILCVLGQSVVFSEASELCHTILNVDICRNQIQRICKFYGGLIDSLVEKDLEEYIPKLNNVSPTDNIYVMMDGSMLFTRPKEWKEIKLARIFNQRKIVPINTNRNELLESVYVSHMGGVSEFFPKLERHLVDYKNKIVIGDGAPWIWKWVEANYPGAIEILDFYHAKEKLVIFAQLQFKDDEKRKAWVKQKTIELRQNLVEQVIEELKGLRSRNEKAKEAKMNTIRYFIEHAERMMYKTYMDKGLLIGSGPIEAAHRSVLQQRMKLSGQKWTKDGANAIANLRCYRKSGAWNIIKNIVRAA